MQFTIITEDYYDDFEDDFDDLFEDDEKMKVILWKNKSLCHSEWQVMQICF